MELLLKGRRHPIPPEDDGYVEARQMLRDAVEIYKTLGQHMESSSQAVRAWKQLALLEEEYGNFEVREPACLPVCLSACLPAYLPACRRPTCPTDLSLADSLKCCYLSFVLSA